MAELEKAILEKCPLKPFIWWRYIDDIFLIWEHGEENLLKFVDILNSFHPTIKFTVNYSRSEIDFLDVKVKNCGEKLVTDLFVKPTDTHQFLHASSCHVYHSKRAIPYSQALRLNRICSETSLLDQRCNELESWLKKRGYKDRMVRNQILRARRCDRDELLERKELNRKDPDLVLNITYHPAFSKLKSVLRNIHILLTPDSEHRRVFQSIPVIGFKRARSLKDILVRAKLPEETSKAGGSSRCGGKRCDVCKYVCETDTFVKRGCDRIFTIRSGNLNCNSKNIVYLAECKTCGMQYVGSTSTKFRARFNNYKSAHRKYSLGHSVPQASFHAHFVEEEHQGMHDWQFTLIDQAGNVDSVRRKESFWQHTLNTFHPNGLNERNVTHGYG